MAVVGRWPSGRYSGFKGFAPMNVIDKFMKEDSESTLNFASFLPRKEMTSTHFGKGQQPSSESDLLVSWSWTSCPPKLGEICFYCL